MRPFRDHITDGLHWRDWPGAGPVLVCLHGIGSRAAGWQALAEHLPGWRLIAWDAPGYGDSAPLGADWPVAADYAAALKRLILVVGPERFHLLGHSLGTLIGASYARNHPTDLERLTLVSCAQGGGIRPGDTLPPVHGARINDLRALGAEVFSRTRAARLIHDPVANPGLVETVRRAMATVSLPGYGQAVRMLASGDLAADCAQLGVPTTVIVGAQDAVTTPEQSRRAHDAIPPPYRCGLTLVPGAGHALPQQDPAALAAAIQIHAHPACAPMKE